MGGEAFLTVAGLARILNQIMAVEVDAGDDMRGSGPSRVPARRIHHLFPVPLARERRELAMLLKRLRCGEMVLGHFYPPFTALTIFCAASSRSSAGTTLSPDSRMIFLPAPTLVPSNLTTSATFEPTSFA